MNTLKKINTLRVMIDAMDATGNIIGTDPLLFEFEDHIGKRLVVDADNGIVYRKTPSGVCIPFATENISKKADGYLVAVFNYRTFDKDGRAVVKPYRIKQHILVNLVADRLGFEALLQNGTRPVCCHVNSTPYDNRMNNLEWGSVSQNNKQGKMGASLEYYYPGVFTDTEIRKYRDRKNRDQSHHFIKLRQGIRNEDIKNFEAEHYSLKIERGEEARYYSKDTVDDFVNFMFNSHRWEGRK